MLPVTPRRESRWAGVVVALVAVLAAGMAAHDGPLALGVTLGLPVFGTSIGWRLYAALALGIAVALLCCRRYPALSRLALIAGSMALFLGGVELFEASGAALVARYLPAVALLVAAPFIGGADPRTGQPAQPPRPEAADPRAEDRHEAGSEATVESISQRRRRLAG